MLQIYLSLMDRRSSCFLSALPIPLLILFALSYPAISAADNYLDSIEAEADKTTVQEQARQEQKKLERLAPSAQAQKTQQKTTKAAPAPAAKKVTANDVSDRASKRFESSLYKEFPGNYAVYTGLSESDKKEVVAAYQNSDYLTGLARYRASLKLILKLSSK